MNLTVPQMRLNPRETLCCAHAAHQGSQPQGVGDVGITRGTRGDQGLFLCTQLSRLPPVSHKRSY